MNAPTVAEMLALIEQKDREIACLNAMLELEQALRRKSASRLIAAGGAFMAKINDIDRRSA